MNIFRHNQICTLLTCYLFVYFFEAEQNKLTAKPVTVNGNQLTGKQTQHRQKKNEQRRTEAKTAAEILIILVVTETKCTNGHYFYENDH